MTITHWPFQVDCANRWRWPLRNQAVGAEDFAWRLLEKQGVAVLAADTFGPSATGHVRITFAIADAKLAEACERIAAFVEELGRG